MPLVPGLEPSPASRKLLRAWRWTLFAGWIGSIGALALSDGPSLAWAFPLGIAALCAFSWTYDRLSTEFPEGCASLGDLAKRITPEPHSKDDPEAERRVLNEVRRITSVQLGVKLEDVKPWSRFVDDFGMD